MQTVPGAYVVMQDDEDMSQRRRELADSWLMKMAYGPRVVDVRVGSDLASSIFFALYNGPSLA